jgi:thiaminase/transcriptional activator TenA
MATGSFVAEARERNDALWRAIHDHPFVRGIGDGSLPRDRFEFYLRQDYVYLVDFGRVLALASARATDLEEMRFFSVVLEATLGSEMELHRRTCADFGIDADQLERTEPALITTAYTGALLRACSEGPLSDIIAVLLPCAGGYVEIARRLRAAGLPGQRHLRDWIETYSSEEMVAMAAWLDDRMNRFADGAPSRDRERWLRLYRTSARFELLFFQMAWEKAEWPEGVPG